MRAAHDNLVRIHERLVERVVGEEDGRPQRGPEVVGAQPEQQLAHEGVEVVVVTRGIVPRVVPLLGDPVGEARLLVVEEDAAVFDGWRALDFAFASRDEDVGVLRGGHVGPEVPRADANLFADVVEAIDGASRHAAYDDEGFGAVGDGVLHELSDERLPFALDGGDVYVSVLDQGVDEG